MKKITLLLFTIFSISTFAQKSDVTIYLEKTETVSFDQYDLIKKVNQFYPDILVAKQVKNNYKNNLKVNELLSSNLVYEIPNDAKFYFVTIDPSNAFLNYSYKLLDDTFIYGDVRIFNNQVFRTMFRVQKDKRIVGYYADGKLLNEFKN